MNQDLPKIIITPAQNELNVKKDIPSPDPISVWKENRAKEARLENLHKARLAKIQKQTNSVIATSLDLAEPVKETLTPITKQDGEQDSTYITLLKDGLYVIGSALATSLALSFLNSVVLFYTRPPVDNHIDNTSIDKDNTVHTNVTIEKYEIFK